MSLPATDGRLSAAINATRELFEQYLQRYLQQLGEYPQQLAQAIRYSMSSGKRLRPTLAMLAAEASGGTWQSALPAALAVEMVHNFSLIHDDLPAIDDDELRRGRATCHKVFGEAIALLAGDALLADAFRVITEQVNEPAIGVQLVRELAAAAGSEGLAAGQVADIIAEGTAGDKKQLDFIYLNKTASLFRAAARMGGYCAGAGSDTIQALGSYGTHLGVAFQAVDDLLDETGDPAAVGKRIHKDRTAGKLTAVKLSGVPAARKLAEEHIRLAVQALQPLGQPGRLLSALAQASLTRSY